MGKLSLEVSMAVKQRNQSRNTRNKYLRPGALAQLRQNRAASRSCPEIGKKRVLVLDTEDVKDELLVKTKVTKHSPSMSSPEMMRFRTRVGSKSVIKPRQFPGSPKTPLTADWDYDSRLESLPIDILVKILCCLLHDQLKAVILVSKRITDAVLLARKWHFNYTTPVRSRQEMLGSKVPLATKNGPLLSKGESMGGRDSVPRTPKAPRQGRCLFSRINMAEMRQIAAVLFQESAFPPRCAMLPGMPEPSIKPLAPTRVLVYEDELCQAVAENKLR